MTRIDVWLWSVRVYKSRSLATAAVKGGHIRLNGDPVKPSHDFLLYTSDAADE